MLKSRLDGGFGVVNGDRHGPRSQENDDTLDTNGNPQVDNARRSSKVKGSWQKLRKHISHTTSRRGSGSKSDENVRVTHPANCNETGATQKTTESGQMVSSKWQTLIKQLQEMNAVSAAQEARSKAKQDVRPRSIDSARMSCSSESDASPVSDIQDPFPCEQLPCVDLGNVPRRAGFDMSITNAELAGYVFGSNAMSQSGTSESVEDKNRRQRARKRWSLVMARTANSYTNATNDTETGIENMKSLKRIEVLPSSSSNGPTDSSEDTDPHGSSADSAVSEKTDVKSDPSQEEPVFLKVTRVRKKSHDVMKKTQEMSLTEVDLDGDFDESNQLLCNREVADILTTDEDDVWCVIEDSDVETYGNLARIRRRSTPDSIRFSSVDGETSDTVNDRNMLEQLQNSTELMMRQATRAESLIRACVHWGNGGNRAGPVRIRTRCSKRPAVVEHRRGSRQRTPLGEVNVMCSAPPASNDQDSKVRRTSVTKTNSVKGKWLQLRKHITNSTSKSSAENIRKRSEDKAAISPESDHFTAEDFTRQVRRRKMSLPVQPMNGNVVPLNKRQSSTNSLIDEHILRALSNTSIHQLATNSTNDQLRRSSENLGSDGGGLNRTTTDGLPVKSARRRPSRQEVPTYYIDNMRRSLEDEDPAKSPMTRKISVS